MNRTVTCPVCSQEVAENAINLHLDKICLEASKSKSKNVAGITAAASTREHKVQPALAPIFGAPSVSTNSRVSRPVSQMTGDSMHKRRAMNTMTVGSANRPGPSSKKLKTPASSVPSISAVAPLSERLRPQTLDDFIGQPQLTSPHSLLMSLMQNGSMGSMIFWGPPGCGKTTLARLLAKQANAVFKELSATDAGVADVRAVAEEAQRTLSSTGRCTILFLDEVHRFNRAQQDIFLPFVEQGIIQLIGATTENPSFKITNALLSRCRVFVLERLTDSDIQQIITRAVEHATPTSTAAAAVTDPLESSSSSMVAPPVTPLLPSPTLITSSDLPGSGVSKMSMPSGHEKPLFPTWPQLTNSVLSTLVSLSNGDARVALSLLELVLHSSPSTSSDLLISSLRSSVSTSFDRTGDDRYDMISALHKSIRGSDGNAAMYWLARMLSQGEDPLYIARRLVVCASEDIGLADNHALPLAIAALQACQLIGMPECRINLAHLVAYLAEAPKDTRAYQAYNSAEEAAKKDTTLPVPLMVRNAPTRMLKEMGYGDKYHYNPDYIHPVSNEYLPSQMKGSVFLKPAGDMSGKIWDEIALKRWEQEKNNGQPWEGRHDHIK